MGIRHPPTSPALIAEHILRINYRSFITHHFTVSRPLFPPRGLFVPITIIKDHSLPETVRFTWIQLRCLAWGRSETPVLSMKQIVDILGKKQSAIYKHMAMLRDQGALRWRPAGCGTFIVSFPDHLQDDRSSGVCETNSKRLGSAQSPENNSTNMESPFNVFVNNSYQKEEKLKNTPFQKSGNHLMDVEFSKKTPSLSCFLNIYSLNFYFFPIIH